MASFAKEFVSHSVFSHVYQKCLHAIQQQVVGQLDSLIPLLVHQYDLSPQAAMNHVAQLVRKTCVEFEAAERRLLLITGGTELDQDVRRFIQGCRDIAAGNLHWWQVVFLTKAFTTNFLRDLCCFIQLRN